MTTGEPASGSWVHMAHGYMWEAKASCPLHTRATVVKIADKLKASYDRKVSEHTLLGRLVGIRS